MDVERTRRDAGEPLGYSAIAERTGLSSTITMRKDKSLVMEIRGEVQGRVAGSGRRRHASPGRPTRAV
ncbi:MAG: hypothetical protein B7Z45_08875 [Azorhizobium sp. 12-66-6]|nr:MAG: hypothetical protein B7Z45_08875 [Azorhizobium sp. 12-66-6]